MQHAEREANQNGGRGRGLREGTGQGAWKFGQEKGLGNGDRRRALREGTEGGGAWKRNRKGRIGE